MAGTTFKIKQSAQAGKIPDAASLVQGELALNTADQKLYSKNSSGAVFEVTASASSILPSMSGNANKFLSTDGSIAQWQDVASSSAYDIDCGSSNTPGEALGATLTFDLGIG